MRHLSVLALGALLAANGAAATQSDFKTFMKGMVPKIERAFAAKDIGFFDSIAAPDFVDKAMGQTATRQQAMAEMKASLKATQSMKTSLHLVSAQASGGTGHAVISGTGTMTMKPGKDGKSHVMKMQFTEQQTWVRSGSAWKLKVLEESFTNGTMDGKPMGGGASGH